MALRLYNLIVFHNLADCDHSVLDQELMVFLKQHTDLSAVKVLVEFQEFDEPTAIVKVGEVKWATESGFDEALQA